MAQWNSDGYIFIDFKDVNFSLTNQTVSGIYQRMVDIVGTNKFILVLNANGRTPMPGTVSLTNGQYVIDTVLYMFSISSNDNLFIRRQDIPAGDIIDDNNISISSTYSSYKIDNTYQKKLTAGDNITISDNTISATDTTYTAGDNVSISADNVISATDTTYTAGDNISIDDGVISATDTTYTAGTGIAISAGNEISCDAEASEITYSNTSSGLTATNAQGAIDEIISINGKLKKGTLTATTNPTGSVSLGLDPNTKPVVMTTVLTTATADIACVLTTTNSNQYVFVFSLQGTDWTRVIRSQVTIIYYYIDLT